MWHSHLNVWKFLKQKVLFPKGLNWVQHLVSRIGLLYSSMPIKEFVYILKSRRFFQKQCSAILHSESPQTKEKGLKIE